MTTHRDRFRVDLHITDFPCSPQDITDILGVDPTKTWQKGDLIHPRAGIRYKENGWQLSSGIDQSASFALHIKALSSLIEANLDRFITVGNQYYTEVSCAIYLHDSSLGGTIPALIEKKAIEIFHKIGAEIDFDIYLRSR